MLSVSNISVQFGAKKLFNDVSFIVSHRDRLGLVGSNGTGKSTLLKIINSSIEPDTGDVSFSKYSTVDYLPQDGIKYSGKSLYEEVYSAVSDVAFIKKELDEIQIELSNHPDKESEDYLDLVETYGELQLAFEDLDGFKVKSKIEKILSGLGFNNGDFSRQTDEFSGGWQMRIALSKLLLRNPSVLMLDEPTNHLDIESLLWLEDFLRTYQGAVIIVSHDRKFLDNITSRTIEIYLGKVTFYPGNYSFYEREKISRKELLKKRFLNQQKYLKQQERFIERFRYKATKAAAVQSRIKMLEKLDIIELEDEEQEIHFLFPPATHSGRRIVELKNITKSYTDNLVLHNLDLEIERGEKIGFVGVNGAGKSTLARIIVGDEGFQQGERKLGHKVELEYYSQHQADALEPKHTVFETLDEVAVGDIRKQLRTILGSFLFKGDEVFKRVSVLSGGEKSRLALARMLLKQSNFLVLDEPTNHLDMNSKRVLMRALHEYTGTILIISHDREFLDGIVNKIIEVKDRNIKHYPGNCSEYLLRKSEEIMNSNGGASSSEISDSRAKRSREQKRIEAELRNKLYNLAKPFREKISGIEAQMAEKESRLKQIEQDMTMEDFYEDADKVIKANKEFKLLKDELEELYDQWLRNNNEVMKIESSN